jgi:hypothetical protein
VKFAFEHRAAQITIKVGFDDTFVGDKTFDCASQLTANGFYPAGKLNLVVGRLLTVDAPTHSLHGVLTGTGSTASLSIPATCFAPLLVEMPLSITIKHQGKTYTGSISNVFEAGTSYVYTILIGAQNLPFGLTCSQQDWEYQSETTAKMLPSSLVCR